MSNFHPFEVVGRTSETQLQVGENLKRIIQRTQGYYSVVIKIHVPALCATHSSVVGTVFLNSGAILRRG